MEVIRKEDIKFQKFLSKYNTLNDDFQKKNRFLNNALPLFKSLFKQVDSIIKYMNIHTKFLLDKEVEKNKDNFYIIIKLIIETFQVMINLDFQIIKEILSNISTLTDCIKKEFKKNELEIQSIYNQMKEEIINLELQKKKFYDSMIDAESNLLNYKGSDKPILKKNSSSSSNESNDKNEIIKEARLNFCLYKTSIISVNKIINQLNNREKHILDVFDNIDNNFNLVISNIIKQFYENQNIIYDLISRNIVKIKDIIIDNNNNIVNNKSKDNYLILSKYSFDLYEYQNFPSKIDFLNINDDNEYIKCIKTVKLLNRTIGNIYPYFSIEKESKRSIFREKIKNLFYNLDYKILEGDRNELFEMLKKNEENRILFINILNRLRINGKYKRTKEIINLIGDSMNIILNFIAINKDYDMTKNCIVLSQTFYYENEKKEKKYICEIIKDHEWLKNESFWRNYIDLLISKELMKYQNVIKDKNINIFMKNNIPENISKRIEEILFSQLIPSINNMVEFSIDKKIIIKITEEFIHKYDYLKQNKIDSIYNIISDNKEEIEKLKEEIKKGIISNQKNNKNIKEEKNKEEKIIIESSIKKEEENLLMESKNKIEEKKIIIEFSNNKEENIIIASKDKKEEENKKVELKNKNNEENKKMEQKNIKEKDDNVLMESKYKKEEENGKKEKENQEENELLNSKEKNKEMSIIVEDEKHENNI